MVNFGDFEPLCHEVPSYSWCNLFYRQVQDHASQVFQTISRDPSTAPVGINPVCGIPFIGSEPDHELGNIANIIACGLSIIFVGVLLFFAGRRHAAVCRTEFRVFLVLYLLSLPFQLISTGSFLHQGTTSLTVITAIHAGMVAATFWALLANAIVSTQVVEDGTLSSLIPLSFFIVAFLAATIYISLDVAFSFTTVFGPSSPPGALHSIPLFVLTSIWPGAAALLYFFLMLYIILGILNEIKPVWYYILAATLFVLSQLAYFLLSKVICRSVDSKLDGSFIATILETAAVGVLYLGWRSITEETWDDGAYAPSWPR